MNIVIFDDHYAITATLDKYFKNASGFQVLGTFNKSVDILNYLKEYTVDIIIMDLLTDEELGTELISMLRKKAPISLIVVYSGIILEIIKDKCIESGADIFVSKTHQLDVLHQAIIEKLAIKKVEPKAIINKKPNNQSLTNKEKVIIECMINGLSSPEIAKKLGLSHNTINNQKNHMIKKFACSSSPELVAKLFRQGLLKI